MNSILLTLGESKKARSGCNPPLKPKAAKVENSTKI
jgi:hypothetical protein